MTQTYASTSSASSTTTSPPQDDHDHATRQVILQRNVAQTNALLASQHDDDEDEEDEDEDKDEHAAGGASASAGAGWAHTAPSRARSGSGSGGAGLLSVRPRSGSSGTPAPARTPPPVPARTNRPGQSGGAQGGGHVQVQPVQPVQVQPVQPVQVPPVQQPAGSRWSRMPWRKDPAKRAERKRARKEKRIQKELGVGQPGGVTTHAGALAGQAHALPQPGQGQGQPPPQPPPASPERVSAGAQLAEQFTVFADPVDAAGGAVGSVGGYISGQADDAHPDRTTQAGVLSSVAGGAGMVNSGVTTAASFASLVDNIRNLSSRQRRANMNGLEIADEGMAAAQNGVAGVAGLGITASNAGGFGATVASTADSGLDAASTAAQAFDGIGGGLESVSGAAQLLISTGRTITGVVRNVQAQSKGEATDWVGVGTDAIGILKGALSTAESCLSAISAFTSIAGKAAELANVLPLVGAAVNIAIQLLDIAIQVINGTKHLVKMIQAKVRQKKLEKMAGATQDADAKKLYGDVANVNRKRYNREILPVCTSVINTCADLISIGGSVMNICGVATAPAYGAGVAVMAVGYGMTAVGGLTKVGTALAAPVAGMVRKTKQLSNNVQAGEAPDNRKAKFVKKTGIARVMGNADKSTQKKEARYRDDAIKLFDQMAALPQPFNAHDQANLEAYDHMRYVVKATGVNLKGLRLKAAAGDFDGAVELVVEALKVRG